MDIGKIKKEIGVMLLVGISIITLITFGIMVKALCRYRKKYHEYRDQVNHGTCSLTSLHYVLSCYGDPYIVDFEELIEHPKVSIILPVYNKGWCVEAALRSLQRQTLKEIEIICVDDGSTDDSVEKIKKYQSHDTRIKLIENGENRGTLYARVNGIRQSAGDYIMFLDPDDLYATNDIVEVAYNKCIENDVDVVCFGGYVSRQDSLHASNFCNDIVAVQVLSDKTRFFTNIERYCVNKCVSSKCFFRSLDVIADKILSQHIRHAEDWLLTNALSLCIQRYTLIDMHGYFYSTNLHSLSVKPADTFERAFKHASDTLNVYSVIYASSPQLQDFLLEHIGALINDGNALGPYTDNELQQLYDIYMRINFDEEHKAKLSEYLTDGMAEMRKLRDGSSKE